MSLSLEQSTIRRWREEPDAMVRELFKVEPDPWQLEALRKFPSSPRLAMKACKGPGKAQPKSTVIPTPDGPRKMGTLKIGDRVFAGDGSVTRIVGVYDRGVRQIYRVSFDDGSSTLCCGEHLWKVRGRTERRHDTWSVLSTEEIIARGVREKNGKWAGRHFEIPRQGPADFCSHIALPLDPYVLGVWLGDGVRLKPAYATKPTAEIAQEIRSRGYDVSEPRRGIVSVYTLTQRLRTLGVFHLYSCERFVPKLFMCASTEDRRDVIRGLMDTDGGIGADGHMEFSSTSRQLCEDLIWLVRSVGGIAFLKATVKQPYYRNPNGEIVHGKPCYRVTVCVPFNPFLVPHRKERWKDPARSPSTIRYMTRKIDAIEPVGIADCVCIAVEHPDKTYLTNDFIVTHNTAVLAWLGWNFLLTRPFPIIGVTSISGDNLKTNLWTELARWRTQTPLLDAAFEQTKTEISARDHKDTWKLEARTWARDADANQIGNALAGIHGKYVMWLLDESGDYPDAIMPTCEGIFAGNPIEAHIVQAGNPTRLGGPLYRACTSSRKLWTLIEITADPDDPNRSSRISIEHAREQIEQYGRDNPWVLWSIFGQFPPAAFNALIGPDELSAAARRVYTDHEIGSSPRLLGIDVARQGLAQSVIAPRQGLQMFNMLKYRGLNSLQGASQVSRKWQEWGAAAAFVDATGGFGAGWIDQLIVLGRSPIGIQFSSDPHDKSRYANKRAEMCFDFVEWIKRGGAIPNDPMLIAALSQTTYTHKGDKLILEPKELVTQKLGGHSPDEMDAGMLTFAEPIAMPTAVHHSPRHKAHQEWNPYAEDSLDRRAPQMQTEWSPYGDR